MFHEARTVNPPDVMPVIQCPDDEILVGEEILFGVGLRCGTRVDARDLYARTCRLVVTAPDGSVSIHERGNSSYDGPSRIASLIHCECLNDLVDSVTAGTYDIRYICGGNEAQAQIRVAARAPAPAVEATFPDPIDVEPGRPFALQFEITNRADTPVRIVAPDSCYAASVVGFMSAEDPPSWSFLTRAFRHDDRRERAWSTKVSSETFGQLRSIELHHDERYRFEVAFEGLFRPDTDKKWMPRERFEVTVGFVLHTLDSRDARPVRWLKRKRADYIVDGSLQSIGEARCRPWEWVRVTPRN